MIFAELWVLVFIVTSLTYWIVTVVVDRSVPMISYPLMKRHETDHRD